MDIIKPWYMSRTIWASIITVASAGAAALGVPIDPADSAVLTDTILQTVAAVSGLVAIFGRLAARTRIR
ncbi:hypothetical protein GTW25_00450 [Aliihoeflea aestuarii]|jgi:hypothetical protein|uniref:hypothetical protein n=1 Tax=Aliihoeflea aestuarii TaxID=453840 RepID=UPI0020925FDC|nr:hypothetical protein [Aliihoeflea aestuarii]MCO6389499.1 hypothetical protein [Aliihoeflea aestuarii]